MNLFHGSTNPAPAARQKTAHGEIVGLIPGVGKPRQGRKKMYERFCRPVRGFFRFGLDAHGFTVGYCRSPLRGFLMIAAVLYFAFGAAAKMTNDPVEAVIQGRQLAGKILEQWPTENLTNTGVLMIDHGRGARSKIPIECDVIVTPTNWSSMYETTGGHYPVKLVVVHSPDQPNHYRLEGTDFSENGIWTPFAGSDFWFCDLGLEFFHWPDQKILKPYEMRRGRSCKVLESINPNPSSGGYSRVVSWIDNETLGIVQAEAYDAKGKPLKEFSPKDFKKVNGQWEVGEMEMSNDQTDSRSWIKFNLNQRR